MFSNRQRRSRSALVAALAIALSVIVTPFASSVAAPSVRAACGTGLVGDALPAGSSSLSGQVIDWTSQPLEGIRVYVSSPSTGGLASVDTDAAGNWTIGGLGDGTYHVGFFDEGGLWQSGYWSTSGLTIATGPATEVAIAGGDVAGLDVQLPQDQILTISGRVTDDTGSPVEGIEVGGGARGFPMSGCALTNSNGEYSMEVRVGVYTVATSDTNGVHPDGFYDAAQPGNFGTDPEAASTLNVDIPVSGIDIQFPFNQPICDSGDSAGPLPEGPHALSGVVTDTAGSPLESILVYVESPTDLGRGGVQTGSDGTWTFPDLGDSTYIVSYFDPSAARQSGYYTAAGLEILESDAEHIVIAGAPVANVDVELPAEQIVEISGRITDSNGTGVAGIQVDGRSRDLPLSGCTTTDANGDYVMPVRLGSYVVSTADASMTYPDGHYDATNPPTNFTTAFNSATPVLAGQDVAGIDIRFPPTYAIGGRVQDGSAAGIENVTVAACFTVAPDACPASTQTDSNGDYSITRLLDGAYHVRIFDSSGTYRDGFKAGATVTPDPGSADVVTIAGASVAGVDVTTFENARIQGRVTVAGGAPLEGAMVQVCDDVVGLCGVGTTDANGDYTSSPVPPGSYKVQFQDPFGDWPTGYYGPADTGQPVALVADPDDARPVAVGDVTITGIDIELPLGHRLSGTIEASGVGVEGRPIDICISTTRCLSSAASDVDGTFVSAALVPGSYFLATISDLGEQLWYVDGAPASLDPADADPVTIVNSPVTGIVFDATEEPPVVGTPTPAGTDVPVTLVDPVTQSETVSLVFDQVTAPGDTTLSTSSDGPATPAGFQLGDPPTYYEIHTTATFSGQVEVCINYSGVSFTDESLVRLLHFDEAAVPPAWEDVTTSQDLANDVICGLTDSFSAFALFERTPLFGGFEAPVDGDGIVNQVKAGRGIPVTFSLGGDFGDAIFLVAPASQRMTCDTSDPIDQIETTVTAGSSGLHFDAATGKYTYVWRTNRDWAGQCRTLTVSFADGSTQEALFTFTK